MRCLLMQLRMRLLRSGPRRVELPGMGDDGRTREARRHQSAGSSQGFGQSVTDLCCERCHA